MHSVNPTFFQYKPIYSHFISYYFDLDYLFLNKDTTRSRDILTHTHTHTRTLTHTHTHTHTHTYMHSAL